MNKFPEKQKPVYSKLNVVLSHLFDRVYLDYYCNDIPPEEAFSKLLFGLLELPDGREFLKQKINEFFERGAE